ncbi:hypothetical protein J7E96_35925 [Streptomyces sp. ISL-96]|uniref:hypothetical protein n=1 Tax=Streptomyces sp. ISL-96 TaxID=2819191 RepID=UPI001BE62657|nr:hypothetical protein [Streptomyces sp. ISL-96]MBT2493792.1 hypothetical protein [Streptomyces sp. ISL-96]
MTAVVAHSLAVLRVLRRAGRRRALRVVFFLGSLLALGVVWGGQAYAVEAPLPARDPAVAVTPVQEAVPQKPLAQPVLDGAQAVDEAVGLVADVVRHVTRPVGELKDRVAERRPDAPELPAPALPAPALPAPALPAPAVPAPGPVLPVDAASPGGGTEPPAEPVMPVHQGPGDRAQRAASDTSSDGMAGAGASLGLGDRGVYQYDVSGPHHAAAHRSPGLGDCGEAAPPLEAPAGPCGDGVWQSAGDGTSSRSGDQHPAAAFADGARFGLVRGATLPATTSPTYDRPHQILEFPG